MKDVKLLAECGEYCDVHVTHEMLGVIHQRRPTKNCLFGRHPPPPVLRRPDYKMQNIFVFQTFTQIQYGGLWTEERGTLRNAKYSAFS